MPNYQVVPTTKLGVANLNFEKIFKFCNDLLMKKLNRIKKTINYLIT